MNKKVLALVLVMSLIISLFAGCTGDGGSSTGGEPGSQEANASAGEGASTGGTSTKFDDVKLKMLVCWNGGFETAPDQYNNEVATAIREAIGVTVEFEGIMINETEKLNLMFASGDMPDIINAPYWGGNANETPVIKKAGAEGMLMDIGDLLPDYPNLLDAYEIGTVSVKYLENDINYSEFNGATYILPQEVGAGIENETNWAYGIFVRGDVPEALGIDEKSIRTTDELYDFMVAARDHGFKDINGNDVIVATTYHDGWDHTQYQRNFQPFKLTDSTSGYILGDDGKVNYMALDDSFIDKNLFLWKLVNEDILDKECFRHTDSQADEKVGNGSALFAVAQYGTVIKSTELTGLANTNPEMKYTWVGPLNFATGEESAQVRPEGRSGSPAIIFPTTCSNIDAALTYLEYVNSEEGARLCQYGIEGEHYDMVDGVPRMNEEWTEKFRQNNEKTREELRQFGVGYMLGRVLCADKRITWWGEKNSFEAEAEHEDLKAYKEIYKVKQIDGYSIDAIVPSFARYEDVSEVAWDGTTERDYRERAYFAATEEEARQILMDYQDVLRTGNNGAMLELLDWMTEQLDTRDDFVF